MVFSCFGPLSFVTSVLFVPCFEMHIETLRHVLMLLLPTESVPVHVDMNPPIPQAAEQDFMMELTRANGIVDELMQTPVIINLIQQLKQDITAQHRTIIQDSLRREFKKTLKQGGFSPTMARQFALLLAHNTVRDIKMVLVEHGCSIVVYFLCKTVKVLYDLSNMITSGFLHTVFSTTIQTLACTTVDVSARKDDFNFRRSCLTSTHGRGLSLDQQ